LSALCSHFGTVSMTFMNCGRCYRAAGIVDITYTHGWPQAINA